MQVVYESLSSDLNFCVSSQLQNAIRSFVEVTQHYPEELRESAQLGRELESTDITGKTMKVKEYVQVRISSLSFDVFLQCIYLIFLDSILRLSQPACQVKFLMLLCCI